MKFTGRLMFSKCFFQEIPVAHSSKFPIEGLNDANQQYNAKENSFTNNLMKFSKEKHKGSQSIFEWQFFCYSFSHSISVPNLTLARKARPRPIPLLSKVHWPQNIGNVCAYSSTGHSELLGTENANICKGSVSSTFMLDNDLEFREIACFFALQPTPV